MNAEKEIINRVAQSGIETIDLEQLIPDMELAELDIKGQLFQGLILREKDFRSFIKENDWSQFEGKRVAVYCSADAVVPTWAYMLVATALSGYNSDLYFALPKDIPALTAERHIQKLNPSDFKDKRVVIKGCGEREISNHAYVALSTKLLPAVKTLMFGEPCSTVPVYKKRA